VLRTVLVALLVVFGAGANSVAGATSSSRADDVLATLA
jgi:hypothetical protein